MPPHDLTGLNTALADRMADLARDLRGAEPTTKTPREHRFGCRRSLSVMVAGPKRGQWFDHEQGVGGDPLGLIAHALNLPMREAVARARARLGEARTPQRRPSAARPPQTTRRPAGAPPCGSGARRWTRAARWPRPT